MAEEFIIAGWLDYGPHRDQVLEHFGVVAAASRAEPGCLDYVASADPAHPGRVVIFERWVGEEHLIQHFKTPHIAAFRDAIKAYPRSGRDMRRYFIARGEEFGSPGVS